MIDPSVIVFSPLQKLAGETLVIFAKDGGDLTKAAKALDQKSGGAISKAIKIADFKGKAKKSLEILAPAGLEQERIIVAGLGKHEDYTTADWLNLGGALGAKLKGLKGGTAGIVAETGAEPGPDGESAANMALGIILRSYDFKKYKTRKNAGNGEDDAACNGPDKIEIFCTSPNEAASHFAVLQSVGEGVILARDLVNEPANALGPAEFIDRIRELEKLGVEVEVLDAQKLREEKMGAILAVGQGSERPTFAAVMRWNGGKNKRSKPLAFIGKGVVFDSGGLSLKPGEGMIDMKGDMAGAACVTGLMLALAKRQAPVNVVGVVGIVENMPSGSAQRPGDVITSKSGQTIEVLNTDAEGRLVLADLITYTQEHLKPKIIVTLATLTGAIIIALGKEHAGLFGTDDQLADRLTKAGLETGEKVWRLPLGDTYDKQLESKVADMKNIGSRDAGSITAAQFLKRFVDDGMAWAHIDIAGTAMAAPSTDVNQSWGSGFGVRLLDRLIARYYES